MLAEIRAAVVAGDAGRLKEVTHTLKGGAGSFGARAACDAAARLEAMARAGDLACAEEACGALAAALDRLRPALAALPGAQQFFDNPVDPEPAERLPLRILDHDKVEELRRALDSAPLRDAVEAFLGEAQATGRALKEAAETGDAARLGALAHTLKGAAGYLGAAALAAACVPLEKAGRAGSVEGARAPLAEIERLLPETCAALEAAVRGSARTGG
jgi:HPt (histidine-containing phosphotransfer) domain-containing protein